MCAIAGILTHDPARLDCLRAMVQVQAHRGPDGIGYLMMGEHPRWTDEYASSVQEGDFLGLGHCRLAIIDRSSAGAQPMSSADGLDWISYNGEIYNYIELRAELESLGHRFRSRCDTEVLLVAYREWGLRCFERFNGMWALALWDGMRKRLVLSRDRLGVKPLCYAQTGTTLAFASEFKALLATRLFEARVNTAVACDFLRWSLADHGEHSFFDGMRSLPAGHYAVIDPQALAVAPVPFWTLEAPARPEAMSMPQASAQFAALFRDAVRLRLRSDVPVGFCLSGGLDSSAIVCQAQSLRESGDGPLHTFNAASTDPRFDERYWCSLVNERVGASSHFVFPSPEGFLDELDALIWHQEEPFTTASIYAQWTVMRAAREAGIPVMLDGQGADEGLCGYRKYYLFQLQEQWRALRFAAIVKDLWALTRRGDRGLLRWREGARYLPAWLRARIATLDSVMTPAGRDLWNDSFPAVAGASSIASRQIEDLRTLSVPSLLRYEDRNSMAWSIESRVPFLDYRLVEWLIRAPVAVKLCNGRTKSVLRHALRGLVPDAILDRRDKMGFVTAQEEWMRGPLQSPIEACFSATDFPLASIINPALARDEYGKWLAGAGGLAHQDFFRLFLLARWMQRFEVAV